MLGKINAVLKSRVIPCCSLLQQRGSHGACLRWTLPTLSDCNPELEFYRGEGLDLGTNSAKELLATLV